jgi:transcriptional regulator with PAS, ATPase and Fis domain
MQSATIPPMGAPRRHSTQGLEADRVQPLRAAWLVVAPDTPEERRVAIGETPLCIGTEAGVDIQLGDPHVSRRHAEIARTEDGVTLRDLGSRNGTHVEGMAIKEVRLRNGAIITVGTTHLRYVTEMPALSPRQPTAPPIATDTPPRFGEAVGHSEAMRHVFALLTRLAPTELTVLFIGSTGSGKDVLARSVHAASTRSARPFVVFDCGAAAPSLIESELFGHERGAFTGASADRQGAFERAHGGTLFLDEVGELSLDLQPKLLRALEARTVRRVGGSREIPVDVRILAATNRNLEEEVRHGRFREDLFFRLSAAVVSVPALRSRLEDLPLLVAAILDEGGYALDISRDTLDVLESYDWPGNVRELRNVILGAAALAESRILEPRDLIFFRPRRKDPTIDKLPLAGRSLESIEKAAIAQTLRHCEGNKAKAAKALGIAPSTLYEKIKKYRL